jgi:eukaryotic-like serine/threonine-protein kinase
MKVSASEVVSSRPPLPVASGEVIQGRYLVGNVIGEGGMGVVFEAMHLGLEAKVALKIIRSDLKNDDEFVQRFVNEGRAAALLKGEHIARVYDVGTLDSGEPYLVMERLEGMGLEAFLARVGPLEPPEAVGLVLEVCEGLAEAHALAIVHRDIKPANLFLSRRPDGSSLVKILDFGIAKRLADKARRALTNPARSMGSPWYMSPEQMMDPSRVDARSDVWSLGVLLFELLTCDHPFDGEGVPEVCANVLSAPAPSISDFRRGIPHALERVIARCLEKDPARRFPSVGALAESLLEFGSVRRPSWGPASTPRSSRCARSPRQTFGSLAPLGDHFRVRPSAWSGVLAAASVVALAGGVTWAVFASGRDRGTPLVPWSELERLSLPGDPVLNHGPPVAPLSVDESRVRTPIATPTIRDVPEPKPSVADPGVISVTDPGVMAVSDEQVLTPAEARRRAAGYERWLKSQGLVRIEEATVDTNNPY